MIELSQLTDLELLSLLIAGEADDQPLAGRVAVACVPVERLHRGRWGDSLRSVMLARWQFSTFNDDHWQRFTSRIGAHILLAELAIAGLLKSPATGATHYYAKSIPVPPVWVFSSRMVRLGDVGGHIFFQEL